MTQQTVDKVLRHLAERDPDFYMECNHNFSLDLPILMSEPGLMLLSGLPEMGCTALALSVALCLAKRQQKTVLYFTSDSTKETMIKRLLCMEAFVDTDSLWDKLLDDAQWVRLYTAGKILKSIPLHIFDDPLLTPGDISQICSKYDNVGLVVIDRLQTVHVLPDEKRTRKENKILSKLSDLAQRENIPILCLNTLTEELAKRDGKIPVMWDIRNLRPSFDVIDKILFLHREDYFDPNANPYTATCYIRMNRQCCGLDRIELRWLPTFSTFL